MSRTPSFDRDDVVRAARTLFWRDGFEGASIPDLEHATGLGRSSLYHAFGSKRGLFDAAVQSYLDEVVRPRLRPLTVEVVGPGALVDYLTGLRAAFESLDSMPATSGCLLINAAGAPIAHDEGVARVIADYRAELRSAVGNGVRALRPSPCGDERERLADTVTGLVVSAFTMARIDSAQSVHDLTTALHLVRTPGP